MWGFIKFKVFAKRAPHTTMRTFNRDIPITHVSRRTFTWICLRMCGLSSIKHTLYCAVLWMLRMCVWYGLMACLGEAETWLMMTPPSNSMCASSVYAWVYSTSLYKCEWPRERVCVCLLYFSAGPPPRSAQWSAIFLRLNGMAIAAAHECCAICGPIRVHMNEASEEGKCAYVFHLRISFLLCARTRLRLRGAIRWFSTTYIIMIMTFISAENVYFTWAEHKSIAHEHYYDEEARLRKTYRLNRIAKFNNKIAYDVVVASCSFCPPPSNHNSHPRRTTTGYFLCYTYFPAWSRKSKTATHPRV